MDEDDIIAWIKSGLDRDPAKNPRGLARALGKDDDTGYKIMAGRRHIKAFEIPTVAHYLGVPFPGQMATVPVVGKVGAGAVNFVDDGGVLDEVEAPPNVAKSTVAVVVKGDSEIGNNAPDGSLIYYDDVRDPPDETLLDRLCVLWTGDGRALLKRLIAREPTGLWTIQASNGSYERGVEVVAAARVKFIAPR